MRQGEAGRWEPVYQPLTRYLQHIPDGSRGLGVVKVMLVSAVTETFRTFSGRTLSRFQGGSPIHGPKATRFPSALAKQGSRRQLTWARTCQGR